MTPFTCPICSTRLVSFIRVKESRHVLCCYGKFNAHPYVEGTGDNFQEAYDNLREKCGTQQQPQLI